MPWKIEKREGEFCVVVAEGPKKGKTVKCHPTQAAASKHVKALYANVPEAKAPGGGSGPSPY